MRKIVKVRIRQWDDMVEEFGYISPMHPSIACSAVFTKDMKPLCGKTVEVITINTEGRFNSLILYNPDIASYFTITIDMIEKEDRGKLVELQFSQNKKIN